MRRLLLLFLIVVAAIVAACAPSEAELQDAVAEAIQATQEAAPTATAEPTASATPQPTPRPTATIEPPCVEVALDYLMAAEDLHERWYDTEELAASTGRIALAGPVGQLQSIQRELGELTPPPCAAEIHEQATIEMESIIQGFLLFMQQESESRVNSVMETGRLARVARTDTIRAILGEVPSPLESSTNPYVQRRIAADPYLVFREVKSDCRVCGRETLPGLWVAADGSTLLLNGEGTYRIDQITGSTSGRWEQDGDQLCLIDLEGTRRCYPFEKRVDAMLFRDTIYVRQ